jgi:hypothetical protein
MTTSLHINLPKNPTVDDLRATLAKLPGSLRITDDVGRSILELVSSDPSTDMWWNRKHWKLIRMYDLENSSCIPEGSC